MQQMAPHKELIIAPTAGTGATCRSCANCPWMGMNGLQNLLDCLEQRHQSSRYKCRYSDSRALTSLQRMMDFKTCLDSTLNALAFTISRNRCLTTE